MGPCSRGGQKVCEIELIWCWSRSVGRRFGTAFMVGGAGWEGGDVGEGGGNIPLGWMEEF